MVVSAAGDYLVTLCHKPCAHGFGICGNLLLILYILRLHRLIECHCLGCDDMLKRSALHAREHA